MNEDELLISLQRGGKVRSLIKTHGPAPILYLQSQRLIDVDRGEIKMTEAGLNRLLILSKRIAEEERKAERARSLISDDGRQKRILDLGE